MHWKMAVDLRAPLVGSEGRLDPFDGYAVYALLHASRAPGELGLDAEIAEYRAMVAARTDPFDAEDMLDLGMTLWTCHWAPETDCKWAQTMGEGAATALSMHLATIGGENMADRADRKSVV